MVDHFKLPIESVEHRELDENIVENLELLEKKNNLSVIRKIYDPKTHHGEIVGSKNIKLYTTNVEYLKETQSLLKKSKFEIKKDELNNYFLFNEKWNQITEETSFNDKYHFVDMEAFKFLNKNSYFLQAVSLQNLLSPIIYILSPVLMLLLPFIVLHLKGINISFESYMFYFKEVAKTNSLFKVFLNFNELNSSEKTIAGIQCFFYVFSIYNGIMTAIKFYKNIIFMQDFFKCIKNYLLNSINKFEEFNTNIKSYKLYNSLGCSNEKCLQTLVKLSKDLESLTYLNFEMNSLSEIGNYMKLFYEIRYNEEITNALDYSLHFWGYVDIMSGIKNKIMEKKLNKCKYVKNKKNNNLKKNYYPIHVDDQYVSNNIKLSKNMIISGPNASGKTTILKSVLINLIFSQSIGFGCYAEATLKPIDFFHCYLNIPDTSGRDSLFQAEARRCKEIIDMAKKYSNMYHLCIIDELFSGTNPEEAKESATAFMNYIEEQKNINVFLTTHYIDICKSFTDHIKTKNYNMKTEEVNKKLKFKYKLSPGISNIKSGKYILDEMKYPEEILNKFN